MEESKRIDTIDPNHVDSISSKFEIINKKITLFSNEWKLCPKIVENFKIYYSNVEKIVANELSQIERENLSYVNGYEELSHTRIYKAFENLKITSKRLASIKKAKSLTKELKH